MALIMHKQCLGGIQPAPLIRPHCRGLPRAVGAYVLLYLAVALKDLCGLSHVLIHGLPSAVLLPVCPVLPHIQPPGLRQHPCA